MYGDRETLVSLLDGEDQRSWDRLMELVERNAEKAKKRKRKGMELQAQ